MKNGEGAALAPQRDEYRCPQGHPLRRYAVKRTEGVVAYRGEAAVCNACPVKDKCTTSDHGRKVQRSFSIDYRETVRGYHTTEAYKKAIRKRQDLSDGLSSTQNGVLHSASTTYEAGTDY